MFNKKILYSIILMFCLISTISLVSSAPPQETATGLQLGVQVADAIALNKNITVNVYATDVDDGLEVTDADCDLTIYNDQGEYIFNENDVLSGLNDYYVFEIDEGNFTEIGTLSVIAYCNNSLKGGLKSFEIIVNNYGEKLDTGHAEIFNNSMWFLMVLFVLSLIGIFIFENPAGKLASYWVCHVLFVVGCFSVWQFNSGFAIAYVGLSGVFKVLFYVSAIAMFPMVILSLAWIFYIHTMNDTIKGFMDRGMDEDEAVRRSSKRRQFKW